MAPSGLEILIPPETSAAMDTPPLHQHVYSVVPGSGPSFHWSCRTGRTHALLTDAPTCTVCERSK